MRWANQDLRLYHGTVEPHVQSVLAGINLQHHKIRTGSDFGPGFYTTTSEHQARKWGAKLSLTNRYRGTSPAVLFFEVSRDTIAALDTLWFVRGDSGDDDYWSLVEHFRGFPRGVDHCRPGNFPCYDVVVGPVAQDWRTRRIIEGSDQVSFHTAPAIGLLNSATKGRLP